MIVIMMDYYDNGEYDSGGSINKYTVAADGGGSEYWQRFKRWEAGSANDIHR